MLKQSLVPEAILGWAYYQKKIPLYLRNSYGFEEFLRTFWMIHAAETLYPSDDLYPSNTLYPQAGTSMILTAQNILNALDIYDAGNDRETSAEGNKVYIDFINSLDGAASGTVSDFLDRLGRLYNLRRTFDMTDPDDPTSTITLTLNNLEFLMLIKAQLTRNRYNGTYAEMQRFFSRIGLTVSIKTSEDYAASAELTLYELPDSEFEVTENIEKMFKAGMLNCESVGINYRYAVESIEDLAIFDSTDPSAAFDVGVFV